MAKKGRIRYVSRRARRAMGRTSVPIMGVLTAGALGAGLMLNGAPDYGGSTPMASIQKGDWAGTGGRVLSNIKNPKTYTAVILPAAVWIVGRMLLGKRKITKKISIF